jgi:glycosyltransferase involved in cell wall biosynthesis
VLERLVARRASTVLAVSDDVGEQLRAAGARDVRLALVPAPAAAGGTRSRDEVRAELGAGGRPLVLTAGRLSAQKAHGLLLDASVRLAPRHPAPLVLIAGDGPLRDGLALQIEHGDLPVRLLGRRDDVGDLMAAADVFVLPSLWEGQPLVLQEALRAGLPIVATDVGGVASLLGGAGVLIPPGDPDALASAVARILDDAEHARRLAAAAKSRAESLPTDADALAQVELLLRAGTNVSRGPQHSG